MILVDDSVDGRVVVVSGPWVEYGGVRPVTQDSADQHQDKQKRLSDWPATVTALRLVAEGWLSLDGDGRVYHDGRLLPAACY